jgi:hypothetical protein
MDGELIKSVDWPKDAWRLRLELDVPRSSLPAIQYAIFAEDPIPQFRAILARMEKPWLAQLNEINDEKKRQTRKVLQRVWAWNHLFSTVPGDEVGLLVASDRDEVTLMSNSSSGMKWVVSKPVLLEDRMLCWSIPFEAVPGSKAEITLNEETSLDLQTIENNSKLE